jgi:hypothetical protein
VTFRVEHEETQVAEVDGEDLRAFRESQHWDIPEMAKQLRRVAGEIGVDIAVLPGLLKMIPKWEKGEHTPRTRYVLLYRRLGYDTPNGTAAEIAALRTRYEQLPGEDQIRALATENQGNPEAAIAALRQVAAAYTALADALTAENGDGHG